MSEESALKGQEKEVEHIDDNLKAAGQICHEMKQPLMISMGFLDLLLLETAEIQPMSGKLNSIRSQIQRLSALTEKLMNLIHQQTATHSITEDEKS